LGLRSVQKDESEAKAAFGRKATQIRQLEMHGNDATTERGELIAIEYEYCKLKIKAKQMRKLYEETANSFANWVSDEVEPWYMQFQL